MDLDIEVINLTNSIKGLFLKNYLKKGFSVGVNRNRLTLVPTLKQSDIDNISIEIRRDPRFNNKINVIMMINKKSGTDQRAFDFKPGNDNFGTDNRFVNSIYVCIDEEIEGLSKPSR